eukprot:118208_1
MKVDMAKIMFLLAFLAEPLVSSGQLLRGVETDEGTSFEPNVPVIKIPAAATNDVQVSSKTYSYEYTNKCSYDVEYTYKYYDCKNWEERTKKTLSKNKSVKEKDMCRDYVLMKATEKGGSKVVVAGDLCSRGSCGFAKVAGNFKFCTDSKSGKNSADDDDDDDDDDD